jgi:hypothetical protein
MTRPEVSEANLAFALEFKKLLDGRSDNSLARTMKPSASRDIVGKWRTGVSLPHDKEALDSIIAVFARWSGCDQDDGRFHKLRNLWSLADRDRDRRRYFSLKRADIRRAAASLLLSDEHPTAALSYTIENLSDIIGNGQLSAVTTSQIVDVIAHVPEHHRDHLTKRFTHILLERTSDAVNQRIREIVASAISKYFAWRPEEREIKQLVQMCEDNIQSSWETMAVSSPTSVGLARVGHSDILKKTIRTLIEDGERGKEDFARVREFYGHEFDQIFGVIRHFENKNRSGLIWANDTNTDLP